MRFTRAALPEVVVIDIEPRSDQRGFFARTWCREELSAAGMRADVAQVSISYNHHAGTLRGMHFQRAPVAETKIVRCTRGAIYDVAVDVRRGSPTRGRWTGVELTAENHRMLYVPEGFAHGFVTLADSSEVEYHITPAFHPDSAAGVRWNDPAIGIAWPREPVVISERDRALPLLGELGDD